MEKLAARCEAAWPKLKALIDQGPADPDLPVAPAVEILQKELELGPFVAQHLARVLAFFYPELYNIERLDCGAGAVHGLLLLHGASQEEARQHKGKLKPDGVKQLFGALIAALPAELRKLGAEDLLRLAEKNGFFPYAARTLEHMCCEYRKALAPKGRTMRAAATPQEEYRALWQKAWPVYRWCAEFLSRAPRPQQELFAEGLRGRSRLACVEPISSSAAGSS